MNISGSTIYHFAANGLGVEPQQCLFAGDGGSNEHEGSRNAGMHPMLISYYLAGQTEKLQERRKKVNWELGHIKQLPAWLEKRLKQGHLNPDPKKMDK